MRSSSPSVGRCVSASWPRRSARCGPGLVPETLAHLFEPFYTTKAEGTGLGLAIAREIALAHRGDLKAANRVDGSGAEFTLVLPASADTNGAPRS